MTGGVREQPPMQKLPQSANADSFLACRLGRRLDCVPLAHGALREGASLRNGGSKRAIPSSQEKALQGFFVIFVPLSWGVFPGKRPVFFVIFVSMSLGVYV